MIAVKLVLPMCELRSITRPLRAQGHVGKMLIKLFNQIVQAKSPEWLREQWLLNGLSFGELFDSPAEANAFVADNVRTPFWTVLISGF